MALNRVIIKGK